MFHCDTRTCSGELKKERLAGNAGFARGQAAWRIVTTHLSPPPASAARSVRSGHMPGKVRS